MLSSYKGNVAVGLYNAAYNSVLFLAFIPSIFLASIFPVLSSKFNSKKNFEKAYTLSFRYLFLILLPLIIGLILLSEKIILLLFGESYISSIYLVKILACAQIFSFMAWLFGFALNSINKQKLFMIASGIGLIINIILNFLFIPSIGTYGAAFSILITHISVFFLLLYFSSKHIGKLNLFKLTIKPIIASAIMAGFIAGLYPLSLIILIPLGGAVYFISLYLIKGFSEEDKEILSSIIKPNDK
jgi:O-antigen/teichoic acid export membrane protein